MEPDIRHNPERKLVGKQITINFANYHVAELWKSFMPRRAEIGNALSKDLISMAVYGAGHFDDFDPSTRFQKWACAEVSGFSAVPEGMETFVLPPGLYAVFEYKGLNTDFGIYHYIFESWLPNSEYDLDDRPHFEILGDKYKNNDPNSEEEIWIPIRPKKS